MTRSVAGFALGRFSGVKETFSEIVTASQESGAALSIWHEGKCVVDLWGGYSDRATNTEWTEDSAAVIFSCTKGLMSLALAQLNQRGKLNFSDPVEKYWPEFAKAGKAGATVKDLVAHRAGVPFFEQDVTPEEVVDWTTMVNKVEEEPSLWKAGESYAYHAITHGWLTGELIRRITGLMPGEYLAQEISGPLSATTWLGINDEVEKVTATTYAREDLSSFFTDLIDKDTPEGNFLIRSLTLGSAIPVNLVGEGIGFNSKAFHQAHIPGAGGISTARGLAKIWSSVVCETDGVRTINDETLRAVSAVQSEGKPFTNLEPPYSRFGMGFQLDSQARRYLTRSSFGHDGAGGQCAFGDPELKVGFAFVTTEMGGGVIEDDRATRLIQQLKIALDA